MDDPWDWDIERVVREFCTPNPNSVWSKIQPESRRPDFQKLAKSLRDNDVDGELLLTHCDRRDLCNSIGIHNARHRNCFFGALKQLELRSPKLKLSEEAQHGPDETLSDNRPPAPVPSVPEVATFVDAATRQRLLAEINDLEPSTTVSSPVTVKSVATTATTQNLAHPTGQDSTLPPPKSSESATPSQTRQGADSTVSLPQVVDEPARKKRRVMPTFVSNLDPNQKRSNSTPYLGDSGFCILDLLDETKDDPNVPTQREGFTHGQWVPPGRRLQMNSLFKSYLLPKRPRRKIRPPKPDTLDRDPRMDEVLPALGESDDDEEYDSETWEELEKNRKRIDQPKKHTGLSEEQVNSTLDNMIQNLISKWATKKLPKLTQTAHSVWHHPKGRYNLLRLKTRDLEHFNSRILLLRERVLEGSYKRVSEVWESADFFEQTVQDQQKTIWEISVLNRLAEPEKPPTKHRQRPVKRARAKSVESDEEEDLMSESDGEAGFIVDDEHAPDSTNGQTHLQDASEDDATVLMDDINDDTPMSDAPAESPPGDTNGGYTMEISDDSDDQPLSSSRPPGGADTALLGAASKADPIADNTGLPLSTEQHTPSATKQPQHEMIDLTSPRPGSPAARSAQSFATPFATPTRKGRRESLFAQPDPWRMSFDDLSPTEQAVAEYFENKLTLDQRSYLFSCVMDLSVNQLLDDIILEIFTTAGSTSTLSSPDNIKLFHLACQFLHLFGVWSSQESKGPNHWAKMPLPDRVAFADELDREEFRKFAAFLQRLSDRFDWDKMETPRPRIEATLQPEKSKTRSPDTDEEEGSSDDEAPGSQKKRRRKVRVDKVAEDLRLNDRARQKYLDERRLRLRAALAKGTLSQNPQRTILNETKDDADNFIYIDDEIASKIEPHQVKGVRFLWDSVVFRSDTSSPGCLLAHTMGLGKTMQVITLLVAIAQAAASPNTRSQIPEDLRRSQTLVICPPGLVANWVDELLQWIPNGDPLGKIFSLDSSLTLAQREQTIISWKRQGGVCVIGSKLLERVVKFLGDRSSLLFSAPNLVILDEAHGIKNPSTKLHNFVHQFDTKARIALTGSPLANNVQEYHSLINWVAPRYLSDLSEFRATYQNPIEAGTKFKSTHSERRKALKLLRALGDHVAPKVQRMTISVVSHKLPPKVEWVITVPLTPIQKAAYEQYINHLSASEEGAVKFLGANSNLSLLCTHPQCLKTQLELQKKARLSGIKPKANTEAGEAGEAGEAPEDDEDKADPTLKANHISELLSTLRANNLQDVANSNKITLLLSIVEECRIVNDQLLVFSQSKRTLDFIEKLLQQRRISLYRLDGKVPANQRQELIKDFNQYQVNVFLISTKAGGVGLNITSANRVVIFDFRFNPQHEQQAIGRAFRIGQKKPVYIYRFFAGGTFEEKMLDMNVFKMQLADSVVDKKISVPRAQSITQMFQPPTEPEQQDLSGHRGKDTAIDRILNTPGLKDKVRAITTTETFEEEADDATLSKEELEEAALMVEYEDLRRAGEPIPGHLQWRLSGFRAMPMTPQGPATLQGLVDAGIAQASGGQFPSSTSHSMPQSGLFRAMPQAVQGQLQQPILGASTSYGAPSASGRPPPAQGAAHPSATPQSATPPELSIREGPPFRPTLISLFAKDAVLHPVRMTRTQSADELARAVENLEGRSPELQLQVKSAILEASNSPRFVAAVVMGMECANPASIAAMNPVEINKLRQGLDGIPEKSWDEGVKLHYQRQQLDQRTNPSTPEASHVTPQPQTERRGPGLSEEAMRSFIQQRQKKQNRDPRLPDWAQTAVNQGGSHPAANPRSTSSPTPVTEAPEAVPQPHPKPPRRPIKSPFT